MADTPRPPARRPVVGSRATSTVSLEKAGARESLDAETRASFLHRSSTTVLFAGLLALLLVCGAAMLWYLQFHGEPEATAERPVVISEVERAAAVAAAAQQTSEILSTAYADYDAEVAAAQDLMTKKFAEEYAQTASDIKADFVRSKLDLEVSVANSSVVRASDQSVQTLIFLNQVSTRDGEDTTVTPYRALVTVVPDGTGWRVSSIETK